MQDPVSGKTIYKDPLDNMTYEWDEEKKAWFPQIGEDFMAAYQLNYGFTKYVNKLFRKLDFTIKENIKRSKEM